MRVRPLRTDDGRADERQVRQLFRSTMALGDSPQFAIPGLQRYEALCLDWYLGPGALDAAVLEGDDGTVVGYALVCTDQAAYRAWTRLQAVRFTTGLLPRLLLPSYSGPVGRFYRLRLRDAWQLAGATIPGRAPAPAHAHFNLARSHRARWAGRLLCAHVDARVTAAGFSSWFGEINAVVGQRASALERLGGEVVKRAHNHTLSGLMNQPVERLTVRRVIPPRDPRQAAAVTTGAGS